MGEFKKGNVDEGVLSEIGFREKLYNNKPIYFKDVRNVCRNGSLPIMKIMVTRLLLLMLDSIDILEGSTNTIETYKK